MSLLPDDLGWLRDMAEQGSGPIDEHNVTTVIPLWNHGLVSVDLQDRRWHLTPDGREAVEAMENNNGGS